MCFDLNVLQDPGSHHLCIINATWVLYGCYRDLYFNKSVKEEEQLLHHSAPEGQTCDDADHLVKQEGPWQGGRVEKLSHLSAGAGPGWLSNARLAIVPEWRAAQDVHFPTEEHR